MSAPRIVTLAGLLLLIGVFIITASPYLRSHATEQAVPTVINRTTSITVTDITLSGDGIVQVTFSNASSRVITFYTLGIGEGQIMPLGGIPAGGTTVQKFSASSFEAAMARNRSGGGLLTILALTFGGGGGEGDPAEISKLEDTALGMKEQIGNFLPALVRAANSPSVESEDNLESLETELLQPNNKSERTAPSSARKAGQDLARLLLSKDLQGLREKKKLDRNRTYKDGLVERLKYYQRRFAEL